MSRNLVYTVALDRAGATGHRNMAKLMVSSLLRTNFSGDIVVFHNSQQPLFHVPRAGVQEVPVSLDDGDEHHEFIWAAQSLKYEVARHLKTQAYDKVLFLDCDIVVLRNIDHLLHGAWSLAVFTETNTHIQQGAYNGYLTKRQREGLKRLGMNSGSWAVEASRYHEFMERWQAVESKPPKCQCLREQSAFNRAVLDWKGDVYEWPHREIALPFCLGNLMTYREFSQAAIVHMAGGNGPLEKMPFLFGLFASRFLCDEQLTLFNVLEM